MPISDFDDLDDNDEWDHGFIELECLQCGVRNRADVLDKLLFPNGYTCSQCDPELKLRITNWTDLIKGSEFTNK